jgi:hypothetical protein
MSRVSVAHSRKVTFAVAPELPLLPYSCGSRRNVGGDAKIEEYLDKKGVTWTFEPKVMPDQFDAEKSLRNQARFVASDEKRVDEYGEAMKRGDESRWSSLTARWAS